MSDREFENYLALLSRLLRLSGKRRAQIADELRAHLDDRLDELTSRGVTRDEAVRQALEEFGDATGLAGQFVAISQNRKRRWLVRLTTFSVAATLLIAAGLVIFWPGRNAAPGWATGVAQIPQVDPFAIGAPPANALAEEPSLQEKLNKRIDFDVVEVPLKDVFLHLRDQTQIQFVLQLKKLEEAGVSADTPITKSLRRVRVSTLLDLMLADLELTYMEKDDLLLITTPEDAESTMEIRVYDCRDLLAMATPAGQRAAAALPPVPGYVTEMRTIQVETSNGPELRTVPVQVPATSNPAIPRVGNFPLTPPSISPREIIPAAPQVGNNSAPAAAQLTLSFAATPGTGYLGAIVDDAGNKEGVVVESVKPGGPAEAGGLRPNDRITAFNGVPVKTLDEFDAEYDKAVAGQQVAVTVFRNGEWMPLSITLWSRPRPPGPVTPIIPAVPGTFSPTNAPNFTAPVPTLNPPTTLPSSNLPAPSLNPSTNVPLVPAPPTRTTSPKSKSVLPQLGGLEQPRLEPSPALAVPPASEPAAAPATPGSGGLGGRMATTPSANRQQPQPMSEQDRRTRELTELVTTIVDQDSWREVGGPGAIDAYNGLVVVAQTAKTHKRVERLFDMLREAAGLEVPKSGKVVR